MGFSPRAAQQNLTLALHSRRALPSRSDAAPRCLRARCQQQHPPPDELQQYLTACAGGATLPGIDVSSYQGIIDWNQVHGAGYAWAYAKATEGTGYRDPTFPGNWSGMQSAGLSRGAYHFFHPGDDGTTQADYYLGYVGTLGAGDLPPCSTGR